MPALQPQADHSVLIFGQRLVDQVAVGPLASRRVCAEAGCAGSGGSNASYWPSALAPLLDHGCSPGAAAIAARSGFSSV